MEISDLLKRIYSKTKGDDDDIVDTRGKRSDRRKQRREFRIR